MIGDIEGYRNCMDGSSINAHCGNSVLLVSAYLVRYLVLHILSIFLHQETLELSTPSVTVLHLTQRTEIPHRLPGHFVRHAF